MTRVMISSIQADTNNIFSSIDESNTTVLKENSHCHPPEVSVNPTNQLHKLSKLLSTTSRGIEDLRDTVKSHRILCEDQYPEADGMFSAWDDISNQIEDVFESVERAHGEVWKLASRISKLRNAYDEAWAALSEMEEEWSRCLLEKEELRFQLEGLRERRRDIMGMAMEKAEEAVKEGAVEREEMTVDMEGVSDSEGGVNLGNGIEMVSTEGEKEEGGEKGRPVEGLVREGEAQGGNSFGSDDSLETSKPKNED